MVGRASLVSILIVMEGKLLLSIALPTLQELTPTLVVCNTNTDLFVCAVSRFETLEWLKTRLASLTG